MKKIIVITQKVDKNDDLLGFFTSWIRELSNYFDQVDVIALEKGAYDLPNNVKVYSIGKERNYSKLKRFLIFYRLLFKLLPGSSAVFAHMSPIFAIASWPVAKLFRCRVVLWYLHRSVTLRLRLALLLSNNIVTAAKESLRIKSNKIIEVGHGIDVAFFRNDKSWQEKSCINIISVGRISPIKNLETLIQAVSIMNKNKISIKVDIIGRPIMNKDNKYLSDLKRLTEDLQLQNIINFAGFVPYSNIADFYKKGDIAVNLAPRGGVDKVVLEAMASGLLVLATNETLAPYFGEYRKDLVFKYGDFEDLADKISNLISLQSSDKREMSDFLVGSVEQNHNLVNTIQRISDLLK